MKSTPFSDYKNEIDELLLISKRYTKEDVFYYDTSEYKSVFDNTFIYFKAMTNGLPFPLKKKLYLLFNNSFDANAKAVKEEKAYIIVLNLGIIKKIINVILVNKVWSNSEYIRKEFLQPLQLPSEKLVDFILQIALNFLIHHEYSHIIQFNLSNIDFTQFEEKYFSKQNDFNFKNHLLEYDADHFASLCLADYFLNSPYFIPNKKELEKFIEITAFLIASIPFVIVTLFDKYKTPFYIERHNHPHPYIRGIVISSALLAQIGAYTKYKNQLMHVMSIFKISELVLDRKEFRKEMILKMNESGIDILNHIKYLYDNSQDYRKYATPYREYFLKNNPLYQFKTFQNDQT